MIERAHRRLRPIATRLALFACLALLCTACQPKQNIRKADIEEFHKLLETGLNYQPDPYVRAESLRLLETLKEPSFTDKAKELLTDEAAVVRVAALRVLLANAPERASGQAVSLFENAGPREKRAIFDSVLEYSPDSLQRKMLWRALRTSQPSKLRRYAFREGVVPRVKAAVEQGDDSFVRKLFLPNVNRYVQELDPQIGGVVLELMLELGEEQRAKPIIETFADASESLKKRLLAGNLLVEAGVASAKPTFEAILEEARIDPDKETLAVPEQRIDERLVRVAALGMVAAGETDYVQRAKRYMKDASTSQYIDVLEALSSNPSKNAALALENAMRDARPRVRLQAIELYGKRDDAKVEVLLSVLQNKEFAKGTTVTRQRIASVIGRRFPDGWVSKLEKQLTSDEGILPALELLQHVYDQTGDPDMLEKAKDDLVRIAKSKDEVNAPRAAYLLVKLPAKSKSKEINEILDSMKHPLPRYAHLENIVRNKPAKHVDFLIENFYAKRENPENFAIRLMSGAGLWVVENSG